MSRFKFTLFLVLIAGAGILIAIAILNPNARSRPANDPDRQAIAHGPPGEGVANRDKKPSARVSESDAVLKSLVKLPGESDSEESNAPRMQRKQIKMH